MEYKSTQAKYDGCMVKFILLLVVVVPLFLTFSESDVVVVLVAKVLQ